MFLHISYCHEFGTPPPRVLKHPSPSLPQPNTRPPGWTVVLCARVYLGKVADLRLLDPDLLLDALSEQRSVLHAAAIKRTLCSASRQSSAVCSVKVRLLYVVGGGAGAHDIQRHCRGKIVRVPPTTPHKRGRPPCCQIIVPPVTRDDKPHDFAPGLEMGRSLALRLTACANGTRPKSTAHTICCTHVPIKGFTVNEGPSNSAFPCHVQVGRSAVKWSKTAQKFHVLTETSKSRIGYISPVRSAVSQTYCLWSMDSWLWSRHFQ